MEKEQGERKEEKYLGAYLHRKYKNSINQWMVFFILDAPS